MARAPWPPRRPQRPALEPAALADAYRLLTLDRADAARHLTFVHEPRKLPVVLSPEEVARLLEAAPGVKYKAALSVAYGAGLRVSEVVSLKVSDIDSKRMMLGDALAGSCDNGN